ncbi:MAG: hypothetical protein ABL940_06865 [Bacteroidia bacterium]
MNIKTVLFSVLILFCGSNGNVVAQQAKLHYGSINIMNNEIEPKDLAFLDSVSNDIYNHLLINKNNDVFRYSKWGAFTERLTKDEVISTINENKTKKSLGYCITVAWNSTFDTLAIVSINSIVEMDHYSGNYNSSFLHISLMNIGKIIKTEQFKKLTLTTEKILFNKCLSPHSVVFDNQICLQNSVNVFATDIYSKMNKDKIDSITPSNITINFQEITYRIDTFERSTEDGRYQYIIPNNVLPNTINSIFKFEKTYSTLKTERFSTNMCYVINPVQVIFNYNEHRIFMSYTIYIQLLKTYNPNINCVNEMIKSNFLSQFEINYN